MITRSDFFLTFCRSLRSSAQIPAPAIARAIRCASVTSDAARMLTAWKLTIFTHWLRAIGPNHVVKAPMIGTHKRTENCMKNVNTANARLAQSGKSIVVTVNGQTGFLNINLVKYLLGIQYTKKNGTLVSEMEIVAMKQRSLDAYIRAVKEKSLASV